MPETVETVIVGAGHAGLSVSCHLAKAGHGHLVLERGEIAETWRSQRWDSFTVNSPNSLNQLPGDESPLSEPDGFWHRDELLQSMESHASALNLPVRTGVDVTGISPGPGGKGFEVEAEGGSYHAANVVVASGAMQTAHTPEVSKELPSWLDQVHTADYRNPDQLKSGGVLIIGSAQSGVQIAEELIEAGRPVYLCTSKVGRSIRLYRGRDVLYWRIANGSLYQTVADLEDPNMQYAAQPQVSGTRGGHTISLQQLARDGVVLLGCLTGVSGDQISLRESLVENCDFADGVSQRLKVQLDAFIEKNGIDAPPAVDDPVDVPNQALRSEPVRESLDLKQEGISTVIWCTGFTADFSWIQGLELTSRGAPVHTNGVSSIPGLYFNGFPWLRNRASSLIYGGVRDSEHIASMITGDTL
jgi:putative flavoprotein involved in K+ transport